MPTPRAGDVGDFLRGGESRQKNQIEDLPFRQARRLFGGDHSALHRFLSEALDVQSGTIVADFDVDPPTFMKSAQNQAPGGILSSLTRLRKFDSVVHGIGVPGE